MRIAIIGGKLQGLEAAYLTKKASWQAIVLDKNETVPAKLFADEFYQVDIFDTQAVEPILKKVDLVLPALENQEVLKILEEYVQTLGLPFIHDPKAYTIASSKIKSNELFSQLEIPIPTPWPQCGFPIIAKPSGASGSEGVLKIKSPEEFQALFPDPSSQKGWVFQQFLEGPSYSIEVIGYKGDYQVFQITELEMDAIYDCKRVLAPAGLSKSLQGELEQIALKIARAINLNGIMDVEVILSDGQLKVLEIDCRLPSQTPTAVYQSTGINMVEVLGNLFLNCYRKKEQSLNPRGVVFEHLAFSPGKLEVRGEHIISQAGPLELKRDFYGADEALTNFSGQAESWVATLIITGSTRKEAWEKRCQVIEKIIKAHNVIQYKDLTPGN